MCKNKEAHGYRVLVDGDPIDKSWYLSYLYAQQVFDRACRKSDAGCKIEMIDESEDGTVRVVRSKAKDKIDEA